MANIRVSDQSRQKRRNQPRSFYQTGRCDGSGLARSRWPQLPSLEFFLGRGRPFGHAAGLMVFLQIAGAQRRDLQWTIRSCRPETGRCELRTNQIARHRRESPEVRHAPAGPTTHNCSGMHRSGACPLHQHAARAQRAAAPELLLGGESQCY